MNEQKISAAKAKLRLVKPLSLIYFGQIKKRQELLRENLLRFRAFQYSFYELTFPVAARVT